MSDKRFSSRWNINWQAQLQLEGARTPVKCVVKNINFKGMQISSFLRLPRDAFLKLSIIMNEGFCLDVEVWVAWHKRVDTSNLYGLYFRKINDTDKERIYRFIFSSFPAELSRRWWEGLNQEKGGKDMDDRRIFERFPVNFSLTYLETASGRECPAEVKDLSAKGVGILANENLLPQDNLEMWIQIPKRSEPFYTRGKVVWSKRIGGNQYKVGVSMEKAELMGLSQIL